MTAAPPEPLAGERWQRLRELLDQGLALPGPARETFLTGLPAADADLAPRLRALLAHTGEPLAPLPTDRTASAGAPGQRVGPYRLLRLLGEGGMASVWLAERVDELLQARPVALKLPRLALPGAGLAERLAREREILATLQHPNIAALYDAGMSDEGQPWLALEVVHGQPIDAYCRDHALGVPARLRLFLQVLQAVAHAHSRLVVHRDLKPANILVTPEGQVRLLDFGVAKLLEEGLAHETALTRELGRALTLDYAAPEQIRGEALGTAVDVYGLGVVLCELLCGQRPYRLPRASRAALEDAILQAEPVPPSQAAADQRLRAALRGDLDTIVLKALKKRPEERYASVQALADDLQRHLQQQPVLARPDSRWYRWRRFVRRHRLGVAAGAALAVAVLGGTSLSLWQARQARIERAHAQEVKNFIASMLREASPYHRADSPAVTALDLVKGADKRLAQAVGQQPAVHAELAAVIVESLMTLGDNDAAASAAERAVAHAAGTLGNAHALTWHLRAQHAQMLRLRGRTAQAQAELDGLLPVLRARGNDAPDSLVTALQVQALLHIEQGRHAEAAAVAEEASRESAARLGDRHSDTVACASLLTQALLSARRFDAAAAAGQRALTLALALYGDTEVHPRVMEARNAQGRALTATGRLQDGVALIERSAADAQQVFGADGLMVGYYLQNAVDPLITLGELDRAQAHAARGLAIIERLAPKASFPYGFALSMRGLSRLAAARSADALPDLQESAAVLTQVLGPASEHALAARAGLALALGASGQGDAARAEAQAVVQALPAGTAAPPLVLRAHAVLARLERQQGQPQAALPRLQQVLKQTDASPRGQRERAHALAELGQAQLALGQDSAAAQTLQQALQAFQALQTRPTPAQDEARRAWQLTRGEGTAEAPGLASGSACGAARQPDVRLHAANAFKPSGSMRAASAAP
ncbi:serine/threonine protein kinase [Burkholderiales bacterium JOSHI_001]|nr:serine/threonine protein kinase [Burkholderiales bacterium JOSHI_001]